MAKRTNPSSRGKESNLCSPQSVPSGLVEAIKKKKCVAFVGSGLSRGAGFLDWRGLLIQLSQICESGCHASPSRISSIRALIETGDTTRFLMAAEDLRDCLGPDH